MYVDNVAHHLCFQIRSQVDDNSSTCTFTTGKSATYTFTIKVITKLPNSEQSYKGKVKTHNYINRQNRQQLENCENRNDK